MAETSRLVDLPLPQITDRELLSLISELHHVTSVSPDSDYRLWGFLCQCHYPLGAGEWFAIDANKIIPGGLLSRKIRLLEHSAIYKMCDEIARTKGATAEVALNMSLYVFLNKFLPNFEKKPKKGRHDPRDWF